MSERLSIPELDAVTTRRGSPRFKSALLQPKIAWTEDANYLREVYGEIQPSWCRTASDRELATDPRIRELVVGLEKVASQVGRDEVFRLAKSASREFRSAENYIRNGEFSDAVACVSRSLVRASQVLNGLASLASRKQAYGYDVSGEVMEPGEQESRSPNLWDQSNSPNFDHTSTNPANVMIDPEAEQDFPEELEGKHERVDWPARTR